MSRIPIDQSAADYRLITRKVADVFRTQIRERNQFLRGLFAWVGFDRVGVPFEVRGRAAGQEQVLAAAASHVRGGGDHLLQQAPPAGRHLRGARLRLARVRHGRGHGVQYFRSRSLPPGWATIVIITAGLNGIQLMFLGMLGEYIGAIFDEVKARPHYVVQEKVNFPGDGGKNAG